MTFVDFPSQEDLTRIHQQSPCIGFKAQLRELLESLDFGEGIESFVSSIEFQELVMQLHHREVDAAKSYVMLYYYYEQGIPDDEWFLSPGKDGSSVQYFPHFEERHHHIKDWFDYFSDTFYYKLFSAWDTTGHILNAYFSLGIDEDWVTFSRAINMLRSVQPDLWMSLDSILESSAYKRARKLRNDITHNYLPGSAGLSLDRKKSETAETITVGIRPYTTSREIMENADEVLLVFRATIDALIKR